MIRQSKQSPQLRHPIDPVAFFLAMAAGPLLVALLGFPLLLIPVFALVIGGPLYLTIGIPVMLVTLSRNKASARLFGWTALLTFTALLCAGALVVALAPAHSFVHDMGSAVILSLFGFVFAPLWGSTSGWLYTCWRRDIYSHPITL